MKVKEIRTFPTSVPGKEVGRPCSRCSPESLVGDGQGNYQMRGQTKDPEAVYGGFGA